MASQAPVKAQTVSRVIEELRRMIVSGELLPGQQIRQEGMAERLGVSRLPIREALRQLTADGLVKHIPNVGYMVARLSRAEFDEIYFMRKVLETELIMVLPKPTTAQLDGIVKLNDLVIEAAEREDLAAMQHHNHDFHFAIFDLSDLKLVIGEIERFWTWASPYHAVYLFSPDSRRHVLEEHATMIEALRQGDNELLARTMDQHRHGSETQIGGILGMAAGAVPVP
ncbi:GntR family transcriptional regulator [Micromonospora sp. NPDC005206]|uniref:GntR family transcriptional regulator n=1 Tax=Micromonospora sp. NPDC005206 TaxID=3157022 RepID=UPI0033AAD9DC